MPNGSSGEWKAIGDLRAIIESHSARIAVLESQMQSVIRAVEASEKRILERIDDSEEATNRRLDRTRNTALALLAIAVPVVSALIGALIQSGAAP